MGGLANGVPPLGLAYSGQSGPFVPLCGTSNGRLWQRGSFHPCRPFRSGSKPAWPQAAWWPGRARCRPVTSRASRTAYSRLRRLPASAALSVNCRSMQTAMKFICLLLNLLILTACGEVTIEAAPGWQHGLGYEAVERETQYTVKMKMLEVRGDKKWAPMLAFGMIDIESHNRLELYLTQYSEADEYLTAGYRYIEQEQVVWNAHLLNKIPIGEAIVWKLSWTQERSFSIEVANQAKAKIDTDIQRMAGYVKVSGAKGKIHRY